MQKNKTISASYKFLFDTAINEYNSFLDNYTKEEILVFVLQRPQRALWKWKLKDSFSNNISSYFSFVQREIKENWDLVIKNSKFLNKNILKPIFLTFESSQTLMIKVIEYSRVKGKLKEIAFSDEELAQKMLSNLYNLATNNISYSKFSKLIKNQELSKELLKDETYEELNNILDIYITRTLKEGVIDYPAALYIYNNSLLKDLLYLQTLKKYKKIIVNDFNCQIPSICNFLNLFQCVSLYENSCGPYGIYFPNGKKQEEFIKDFLETKYEKEKEDEFLNKFYNNLFLDGNLDLKSNEIHIKNTFESKIQVNDYLIKMINKYGNHKRISIVSPCRNILLEYLLSENCKNRDIPFINFDKSEKIIENPYIYALSSLAILYYDLDNIYLNSDELKQILVLIFDFSFFKASEISNKTKIDKNFLEKILKNSKNLEIISIQKIEFFIEFFKKNYENANDFYYELSKHEELFSTELIKSVKKLEDISKKFIENIKIFKNIKNYNFEFFINLRKGLKESESLEEIYAKLNFSGVILGTPSSFLNYNKESDITILIDIENNLWNIKFVNVIQNPFILGNYFHKDFFYDFETDNQLKREELFNIISRLKNLTKENLVLLGIKDTIGSLLKESIEK